MDSPMQFRLPLLVTAAAFSLALPAGAEVVFQSGFEVPAVKARTPKASGGDITQPDPAQPGGPPAWRRFEDQPHLDTEDGSVVAGVTQEVARSGKQALFVEVSKLSAPYVGALWVTHPIAIEGGKDYRASLWVRNDTQKPLLCAAAQLFLKMQVDFFTDEGNTETGESHYLLQPLPGSKGHPPLIVSNHWTSVGLRFSPPADAKFMVVSFRCDSSAEKGAISGTLFFDDFTVETVPAAPDCGSLPTPSKPPISPANIQQPATRIE